jgi:sodium/proline symporter
MIKLITLAVYFFIIFAIGVVASKKVKTSKDFILGNRNFSALTTALGAGAADMSQWLMMGLPGLVYLSGMNAIWLPIGLTIGAYYNWKFIALRLRVETQNHGNAMTIPGYLSNKLNDKSGVIKLIIAVMTIIFFVIYISSALFALASVISSFSNFEYIHCLAFSAVFIFIYTSIGGFVAISWIDVMQGSLMLFTLLIVPAAIIVDQGGVAIAYEKIQTLAINFHDPFLNESTISVISTLSWGLGYFGQLHILVRFMATKNPNTLKASKNICMGWMILSLLGAFAVGLFGRFLFGLGDNINPETIFLLSADKLFPEWLSGVVLAAVLSAIMSTVSAQLHATASSVTEDLLPKISNNFNKILMTRITMLIIIFISAIYAYDPKNTVFSLASFAWAGLGSAFGPTILFALYSKKMTRDSALYGIITGGLTVLIWHSCKGIGGIFELYEIIPGFLLSSIAIAIKNNKNLTTLS